MTEKLLTFKQEKVSELLFILLEELDQLHHELDKREEENPFLGKGKKQLFKRIHHLKSQLVRNQTVEEEYKEDWKKNLVYSEVGSNGSYVPLSNYDKHITSEDFDITSPFYAKELKRNQELSKEIYELREQIEEALEAIDELEENLDQTQKEVNAYKKEMEELNDEHMNVLDLFAVSEIKNEALKIENSKLEYQVLETEETLKKMQQKMSRLAKMAQDKKEGTDTDLI